MSKPKLIESAWVHIKFKGFYVNTQLERPDTDGIEKSIKKAEKMSNRKSISYQITECPF